METKSMNPTYSTSVIRQLLLAAFTDEKFTFFCYDHFREVYQKFSGGMTFTAKTQTLIEHCELRSEFSKLLRLIQAENLAQYTKFASNFYNREPFEPEMIFIPAGDFLMGSTEVIDKDADPDEYPQHRLNLSGYYLAKTPITNAQFREFVQAKGYETTVEQQGLAHIGTEDDQWKQCKEANWQHPSGLKSNIVDKDHHPVVQVSWYDAIAYCRWLAEITGKLYYLPSEAEWEKGARGTDGRIYPWANEWDDNCCNAGKSGPGDTSPVGSYPNGASPYGLLDMAGNVWEWTRSLWGEKRGEPEYKYPYWMPGKMIGRI